MRGEERRVTSRCGRLHRCDAVSENFAVFRRAAPNLIRADTSKGANHIGFKRAGRDNTFPCKPIVQISNAIALSGCGKASFGLSYEWAGFYRREQQLEPRSRGPKNSRKRTWQGVQTMISPEWDRSRMPAYIRKIATMHPVPNKRKRAAAPRYAPVLCRFCRCPGIDLSGGGFSGAFGLPVKRQTDKRCRR